jgi:DNA-binding CsgD family transcriptional regulator/tetratricopeptide (TPR) repeat protein
MGRERAVRIGQVPYARRWPVPYLWSLAPTVVISLWPVAGDNPGEMGSRMASPTFVGRVEELQLLEAARRRAADADPAVVLVGGEAGVGKTRLVAELTARCAEGTRVLAGGCVPVGDGALPYAPIVEALRALLGDVGVGAVRELVGPSWPELARLLPALGAPESAPAGQAAQARLFELLLGLLGRLGEQAPLVWVVEDLHWADRSTRDLLAFLARNLRRERLLLVVTYRNDEPGQQRLGPYLAELDRGGPVERVELARLDQIQTGAQLVGLLEAIPTAELVDAVFARSEGNPYFTEELLGIIRSGSSELPATLGDLLRGRLAGLPDPASRVLAAVAVAGRPVPHQLVAAATGMDEDILLAGLRAAVGRRLLVVLPDADDYEVRHALLRQVVVADLLPGERARLHARFAEALAEGPELAAASPAVAAAELAAHWDAASDPARAFPARVAAGLAAADAHAFAEAAGHYQRALELWAQPPVGRTGTVDQVDLLGRAAEAAALSGDTTHAIALLEQALSQLVRAAEPVRAAVLLSRLGFHRFRAGVEADALAAYQEAKRLLTDAPPSAEHAGVLAGHGLVLMLTLRTQEAIPVCEEAITVARAASARAEEADALETLACCLGDLGDLDQSLRLHLEARRLAEAAGADETILRTYLNRTVSLELAGREREGIDDSREGLERARRLGLVRAWGSLVAGNLAWGLLQGGHWAECDRLTEELLAGDSWGAFLLHAARGALLARKGDFPAARAQLDRSLALSPTALSHVAGLSLAELALWEGRHNNAEAAIAEGRQWCAQRDPDGRLPQYSAPWYALALRLAADRAERAASRRAAREAAEARRHAAPIVSALERLAGQEPLVSFPPVACTMLVAAAERSRLEGGSDPERWRVAATAWERLERPFDATYARFRQAEALLAVRAPRAQVGKIVGPAHQTAMALGAAPLRREIELLAQRGRLRLEQPVDTTTAPTAPSSPAAGLGLTQREAEVLALVAEGRTNRQIGQALFITPKTASIHVSRILAKLGVAGRGEAAAVAHRLGLDKP